MLLNRITLVALVLVANLLFIPPVFSADLVIAQADSTSGTNASQKTKLVDLWRPGEPGQRMNIHGRVTSIDGTPLVGVAVFVRQTDGNGEYHNNRYNAKLFTDHKGGYQFASVLPGQYYGIKHVHVWVTHEGYESLDTRMLFKGDQNLDESSTPGAIFLEEGEVNGETMLFGRFDITLAPR